MHIRLLAPALLALATAHAAHAQQSPVTISVFGGQQWNGPIFSHSAAYTEQPFQVRTNERLSVPEATRVGARVSLRVGGPWLVYAEGTHASAHLRYLKETHVTNLEGPVSGFDRTSARRPARITSAAVGVGRAVALPPGYPELQLTLGAGVQHFSLDYQKPVCTAPSGGLGCSPGDPWERSYTVPSLSGGFAVRQAITPKLGIELRGGWTAGRANTKGFVRDLPANLDQYEASAHQTVRSGQASVGLWIRP